jgi:uroporphyrinogen decarboxylase
MNERERILRTYQFQPVDRLPIRHAYGLMPGLLEEWYAQGLPGHVKIEKDIYAYFGFPDRASALPINLSPQPGFATTVLEDTSEYTIATDWLGRTTKMMKGYSSLPLALDFPVKDLATWQDYKRRLVFSPERIGADLEKVAAEHIAAGYLNGFGGMGFYWFPRDLMGDEALCIAYYEQPELVRDILETWCALLEQALNATLQRIRLDGVHFGEDMAYKNACMVSPAIFREFIKPYYDRITAIMRRHSVPLLSVDTDGNLNELIGWLADCGVNVIGPNEVNAGNDIVAYRKRFGNRMAYDGGLDKRVLLQGRPAIDAMLERTIPFMKETGGGWTICLDHRVLAGTPLADFQYYLDRARRLAEY